MLFIIAKEEVMQKKVITRRQFIQDTTLAAFGSSLILGVSGKLWAQPQKKSMVILVRNKEVLDNNGTPREEVVRTMLDQALMPAHRQKRPGGCLENHHNA